MNIPFSRPSVGAAEKAAVMSVMDSGWLTSGPQAERFEQEFAEYVVARHAVAISSATSGMALALAALDIGNGDEVICPVFTFASMAMEVYHAGAKPVFVDCLDDTLNPDPAAIESAITKRTKAILVVHFAGLPCDMRAVQSIARRHSLAVIEDAAHALPAAVNGRRVGGLGSEVTIFSFYANKTITTAEGGMLTTNDPALAVKFRQLRLHGIDRDVMARYTDTKAPWSYDITGPGFKANMPDVLAAIGRVQLARSDSLCHARSQLADLYFMEGLPLRMPAVPGPGEQHAWHLFVVRDEQCRRDELVAQLRQRGVCCSVHFQPMHRFTFWQDRYGLRDEMFPVAEKAGQEVFSLPLFPDMTSAEFQYVVQTLRSIL